MDYDNYTTKLWTDWESVPTILISPFVGPVPRTGLGLMRGSAPTGVPVPTILISGIVGPVPRTGINSWTDWESGLLCLFMKCMVSTPFTVLLKFQLVRMVSFVFPCRIVPSLTFAASERDNYCIVSHLMSPYSMILVTTPAPTVLPPSLIANLNCSSIATGEINSTSMFILSPGITISTPSGSFIEPVTSVVRK